MNTKYILKQALILLIAFVSISMSFAQTRSNYNVLDYGAKADGKTLNTKAIQKAIDHCNKNGGGTVEFPAGNFLTGTLIMKDNVSLNLHTGCKILGSTNIEDYPMYSPPVPNNMDKDVKRALIRGENLKNIGIIGSRIINGQGKSLQGIKIDDKTLEEIKMVYTDKTRYIPGLKNDQRPFLMRFVSCKNITMEGITLQHPAKWTQHYLNCDGITIRDVKVFAHGGENNDMVDIDGSKNVLITGLKGDSDDDGICLKSAGNQIVENVLISDCVLRSRTNPIKAGTDSYGGFRNITITNCYIGPSITNEGYSGRNEGLAGIALELVDGGILENVTISNIVMEEMAAPVFIRLGNRGRTPKPNIKSRPIGIVNNISISNIVARNAGRTGCSIIGEIDHPITNVSIAIYCFIFADVEPWRDRWKENLEWVMSIRKV
jgi:polygalacturonase